MKHNNYNLHQNTNTVILIETNFHKHNRVHFLFARKTRLLCNLVGSVGLTDTGVDGGGAFSLSSSSSNTMEFSTEPSIDKSSNVVGEKGVSKPGVNTASMSKYEVSQLNSMSSRSVN